MDIDIPLTELEIGWFDVRADIARIHKMGSDNIPARSHLYKIANSNEFKEYINTLTCKMSLIRVLRLV